MTVSFQNRHRILISIKNYYNHAQRENKSGPEHQAVSWCSEKAVDPDGGVEICKLQINS
jgi:hypothetical protein